MQDVLESKVIEALSSGEMLEIDIRYKLGMRSDQVTDLLARMTAEGKVQPTGERRRNSRVFRLAAKPSRCVTPARKPV
jgi:transcription initiation factor IIE alpha subunit